MSYRHHNVANARMTTRSGYRHASCTSGPRVAVRVAPRERATGSKVVHTIIVLALLAAFIVLLMHLAVPADQPLHLSSRG